MTWLIATICVTEEWSYAEHITHFVGKHHNVHHHAITYQQSLCMLKCIFTVVHRMIIVTFGVFLLKSGCEALEWRCLLTKFLFSFNRATSLTRQSTTSDKCYKTILETMLNISRFWFSICASPSNCINLFWRI